MHYANGRAAKVGDLVRGKGYNVKHEIIGLLLSANAAATACNCTVAHVDITSQVVARGWRENGHATGPCSQSGAIVFPHVVREDGSKETTATEVIASTEYGQLDAFVAIDPLTGDVLPPETEQVAAPEAAPAPSESPAG